MAASLRRGEGDPAGGLPDPLAVQKVLALKEELREGKRQIRNIVQGLDEKTCPGAEKEQRQQEFLEVARKLKMLGRRVIHLQEAFHAAPREEMLSRSISYQEQKLQTCWEKISQPPTLS